MTDKLAILASADWTKIAPSERAAFAAARKLSVQPWTFGEADFRNLEKHFGAERTLDVLWWTARCQYMTRVADSFQLPLERENVFADRAGKQK